MSAGPVTWTCPSCGHDRGRGYARLANLGGVVWFLGLAAVAYGLTRRSWPWIGAGVPALLLSPLGRVLGGVWWWGGMKCRRCGHVEMLR